MEYYDEMVIGEEEAIWIVKFLLPYINEILLNIKALFSGDPATTMKVKFFHSKLKLRKRKRKTNV